MLTEICQYLKNWFNRKPDGTDYPKYDGVFAIVDGVLDMDELADGQYFRIMGSLFNDGVHQHGADDEGHLLDPLTDEVFTGAVWFMGIPPAVIQLATDITLWQAQYGGVTSEAMSPYQSESFGGYSYSKGGGGASDGTSNAGTWQGAFAARLAPWRKI